MLRIRFLPVTLTTIGIRNLPFNSTQIRILPLTFFKFGLSNAKKQNDKLRLPSFHFDADPDPAFYFDANADPDQLSTVSESGVRIQHLKYDADPDLQHCLLD